jgi:hypothetical protein
VGAGGGVGVLQRDFWLPLIKRVTGESCLGMRKHDAKFANIGVYIRCQLLNQAARGEFLNQAVRGERVEP